MTDFADMSSRFADAPDRAVGAGAVVGEASSRARRVSLAGRCGSVVGLLLAPLLFNLSTRVWADSSGLRAAVMLATAGMVGAVLMFTPGLAALVMIERRWFVRSRAGRTCIAVAGSGTVFWLVWWIWLLVPTAGRVVAGTLWVASALIVGTHRSGTARRAIAPIVLVLALAPLTGIAAVGVLSMHGGIAVAPDLAAAATYNTADNMFPEQWIERVESRGDLRAPALGWPLVERPPAQAAWILPAYSIASNQAFGYEILSATISGLAATAVAVVLFAMGLRTWRLTGALGLVVLTVFMFYNVVFTMPKLLTGALFALALAAVLEEGRRIPPVVWAAVGAALALSAVAHSGGLLALPALLVVMAVRRTWPRDRWSIGSLIGGGLVVMGPWLAYQLFYDRSASNLLKWHLAGVSDPDDARSFPRALLDQYRSLGVRGVVRQRWGNLGFFAGSEAWTSGGWSANAVSERWIQVGALAPLWSGGILVLAAPLFVLWKRIPRDVVLVTVAGLVAILTWMAIEYGPPSAVLTSVNGPYVNYLLLAAGLAAAAATVLPGRVLAVVVAAQALLTAWAVLPRGAKDGCGASLMCMPRGAEVLPTSNRIVLVPVALVALAAVVLGALASRAFADAAASEDLGAGPPEEWS